MQTCRRCRDRALMFGIDGLIARVVIRAGSALSYIRSADPALIATAAERCGRLLAAVVTEI